MGKVFDSLGLSGGAASPGWRLGVGVCCGVGVLVGIREDFGASSIVAGGGGWLCQGDVVWFVGVAGVWGLTG
jgi:hypothetical protein